MIFVDTRAWAALASKRDQYHAPAAAAHQLLHGSKTYVTTHAVLSEVITHLYPAIGAAAAQAFVGAILRAGDDGRYSILELTSERFNRAWELRQKYGDKPDISFVDFTSIAVMLELGIIDVFTGDEHFSQVGLGFTLWPKP